MTRNVQQVAGVVSPLSLHVLNEKVEQLAGKAICGARIGRPAWKETTDTGPAAKYQLQIPIRRAGVAFACVEGRLEVDVGNYVTASAFKVQFIPDAMRRAIGAGAGIASGWLTQKALGYFGATALGFVVGLAAFRGVSQVADYVFRIDAGKLDGLDDQGRLLVHAHVIGFEYRSNDFVDAILAREGFSKHMYLDVEFTKGAKENRQMLLYDRPKGPYESRTHVYLERFPIGIAGKLGFGIDFGI